MLVCASPEETVMKREPAVAGQFYPADAKTLAATVDAMLADVEPAAIAGRVVGIQVPHAGYPYSGPTAASAFRLLEGMDSVTVVMFGTSHRAFLDKAAVYAKGRWKTPLGEVAVDEELAGAIVAGDEFLADMPAAHRAEHSLEVELPFLQRVLKSFKIVPIMLLQPSQADCERVGKAIARACKGRDVVLLASSDLYHGESYDEAKETDAATVSYLAGFDPEGLHEALGSGSAQACGGAAMVAMMTAAKELGADTAIVLHTTNSNDVMGEKGGYCVGYSAAAFVARSVDSGADKPGLPGDLDDAEQRYLLRKARKTIESYVRDGRLPDVEATSPRLGEQRGIFVTLHRKGMLRGCIGYVEPSRPDFPPLYRAVREMAVAAATEDPRFPPVRPEELGDIDIEITVMSPLSKVDDPAGIVVGRHGVVIRGRGRSGLFLPQVPVEQGWNRETYLDEVCRKAGLPRGAWRDDDIQLYTFTGQVFGEK